MTRRHYQCHGMVFVKFADSIRRALAGDSTSRVAHHCRLTRRAMVAPSLAKYFMAVNSIDLSLANSGIERRNFTSVSLT